VAIAAAISPYREIRDENRALIQRFVEVYCECDIDTLKGRDPKGLYEKALAGEIKNFTGVSDPYEAPASAEVVINTACESIDDSVRKIIGTLEQLGYIPAGDARGYSEDEEETIKQRLKDLGYI
jgi:adenylylsulfate kinase-like enzyme